MTEQEIIKYLDENSRHCVAYKALPKAVRYWLWMNRHIDGKLMTLGPDGYWIPFLGSNSCKPLQANMVFTVSDGRV